MTSDAALIMPLNHIAMQRIPGNMNVVRSTPSVDASDSDCRPGAEDEQEQQRLDQRRHDPHAVVGEADHLAPPDGAHGPGLRPPGALGHPDGDDLGDRCAHRAAFENTCIGLGARSGEASASRIVEPV